MEVFWKVDQILQDLMKVNEEEAGGKTWMDGRGGADQMTMTT